MTPIGNSFNNFSNEKAFTTIYKQKFKKMKLKKKEFDMGKIKGEAEKKCD